MVQEQKFEIKGSNKTAEIFDRPTIFPPPLPLHLESKLFSKNASEASDAISLSNLLHLVQNMYYNFNSAQTASNNMRERETHLEERIRHLGTRDISFSRCKNMRDNSSARLHCKREEERSILQRLMFSAVNCKRKR